MQLDDGSLKCLARGMEPPGVSRFEATDSTGITKFTATRFSPVGHLIKIFIWVIRYGKPLLRIVYLV